MLSVNLESGQVALRWLNKVKLLYHFNNTQIFSDSAAMTY